jgi:hypothetical protein
MGWIKEQERQSFSPLGLATGKFTEFGHHYLPAIFDPHYLPVKLPRQILIDGSCSSHSPVVLSIFFVVKLVSV